MDYPHTIRLRGLWGYEVLVDQSNARLRPDAMSGAMRVPGDWSETLGAAFRGRVRFRRTFNWPSQLDPHERVWLVIEGVDAHGEVMLNGQPVGTIDGYALPARFDITSQLASHNELTLDVACPPMTAEQVALLRPGRGYAPGGPIGGVRLEVCSSASIAALAPFVESGKTQHMHLKGMVTGSGDELAVAIVAAGREIGWQTVEAGQPFEIVTAADALPPWTGAEDRWQLTPVECRLVERGRSVWVDRRQMASPPTGMFGPEGINAIPADLQTLNSGVANRRGKRAVALGRWFATREILDDEVYDSLDRSGTRLVQGVLRAWLDRLAPRLAHHPCIVAWTELDAPSGESNPPAYGRPWLPHDFSDQAKQ